MGEEPSGRARWDKLHSLAFSVYSSFSFFLSQSSDSYQGPSCSHGVAEVIKRKGMRFWLNGTGSLCMV